MINNIDAYLLRSLRSSSGLAGSLAYYQTVTGDWRYLVKGRDRIAEVTPEDIQRVAKTYFTKSNRTVATLVKVPAANAVAHRKPGTQQEVRP